MIMIVSIYYPLTGKTPMFTKQHFVHALLLTACCVSVVAGKPVVDGLSRTVWAKGFLGAGAVTHGKEAPFGGGGLAYGPDAGDRWTLTST